MDEIIDILTSDGKPTGERALKSDAHLNGWFHATVHVWIYTDEEQLLLQKRAMTKKVFPGLWDISVAGHVLSGEKVVDAAKREVLEEIGIEIEDDQLINIGSRIHKISHNNGIQDNEFHHVFIMELKQPFETLVYQKEEIDALKLFSLDVLCNTKNYNNVLLPKYHDYYSSVHDKILEHLRK